MTSAHTPVASTNPSTPQSTLTPVGSIDPSTPQSTLTPTSPTNPSTTQSTYTPVGSTDPSTRQSTHTSTSPANPSTTENTKFPANSAKVGGTTHSAPASHNPSDPFVINATSIPSDLSIRIRKVLEDIEVIERRFDLDPAISAFVQRLRKKLDELPTDTDLLEQALTELQNWEKSESKYDGLVSELDKSRSELDESKLERNELRSELNELRSELDELNFLFDIGDWISPIISRLRQEEVTWFDSQCDARRAKFKVENPNATRKDIEEEIGALEIWCLLRTFSTEHASTKVNTELDKVKDWKRKGSVDDLAPETPALDRLEDLSKGVEISRVSSIGWLNLSKDRNCTAHHPPPHLINHLDGDNVRWEEVSGKCEEAKKAIDQKYLKGLLTGARRYLSHKAINTWLSLHVQRGENGSFVPTKYGTARVAAALKDRNKKRERDDIPEPESKYKRGMYDDLNL